jgi:hypothetical protein
MAILLILIAAGVWAIAFSLEPVTRLAERKLAEGSQKTGGNADA